MNGITAHIALPEAATDQLAELNALQPLTRYLSARPGSAPSTSRLQGGKVTRTADGGGGPFGRDFLRATSTWV